MLERTDAITNEVLQPITFVLAYPTVRDWNLNPGLLIHGHPTLSNLTK